MQAIIVTIGDEILIGQTVDTNSALISRHLDSAGIIVRERVSVGDNKTQIAEALNRAIASSNIVIITGGLGPTKDDITKSTLAEMFDSKLVYNIDVANHVQQMMEARGVVFNGLNQGQAYVPEACDVLFNAHGTAPGMWFERGETIVISLPGVPFEMKHLMADIVMPRLKSRFSLKQIVHKTLMTAGLAESMLAEKIDGWESALPKRLRLAYLPNSGYVRLRLSAYEVEGIEVEGEMDREFAKLKTIIPDHIVGYTSTATVQELIHKMLIERGESLAVAESCTGGIIASEFTALAGASAYFKCGIVSYSNESKCTVLGVDSECIAKYGAVSEVVARQMAEGVRRVGNADYGVATTGIAGPTGGSVEKPVGTVWIAVATPNRTIVACKQCGTDREQIMNRASSVAILMLRDELQNR